MQELLLRGLRHYRIKSSEKKTKQKFEQSQSTIFKKGYTFFKRME